MDNKKLREAIDIIKQYGMQNMIGFGDEIKILINFAERYLACGGVITPEKLHQWYLDATYNLNKTFWEEEK